MTKEPLRSLLCDWAEKRLEMSRAVGQMLRHLVDMEKRLEKLEASQKGKGEKK